MAFQAKKTEHAGAKHGSGAYWGPKQDAKKQSSKVRRRNWSRTIREELAEGARQRAARDLLLSEDWFCLAEEVQQKHPVSTAKKKQAV